MTTNEVITLVENETIVTDRLNPQVARVLAQAAPKKLLIQPGWQPGRYSIRAEGIIGTLIAGDADGRVTIHIQPKVPIDNLFYMLTYAHDLGRFRRERSPLDPNETLLEIIMRIFVRQVETIVRQGIQRGYIDHEEQHPFLRGRLLLAEQLRHNVAHAGRFYQRTNEFTADLLENRVLHETLHLLTRVPTSVAGADLRPLIRRAAAAFAEVPAAEIRAADCDRVIFTRLNERYRSPISLARLLLQYFSLEYHAGHMPLTTFLLPMHTVFERFVAAYLSETLASQPRLRVRAQVTLHIDHDRRVRGTPDIIIYNQDSPVAVLDTKYKLYGAKPSHADIYQMFTYARTLGIRQATLIYPHDFAESATLILPDGVRLNMRPLSLAGSLDEFQYRLAAFARQFAESGGI